MNKEELEKLIQQRVNERVNESLAEEKAEIDEKTVEIDGKCADLSKCISTLTESVEGIQGATMMKDELEEVLGELGSRIKTAGRLIEDIWLLLHKIEGKMMLTETDINDLKRLEVNPRPETLELVKTT